MRGICSDAHCVMSTLRYYNLPSGITLHLVRLTFVEGRLCTLLPQSTLCCGAPISGSHSGSCLIFSDAQSNLAPGDYFIDCTWCETAPLHSGNFSTLWYDGSSSGSLRFVIFMLFGIFLRAVIHFSLHCTRFDTACVVVGCSSLILGEGESLLV